MAEPVYSTRFIAHVGLDAAAPAPYQVPAGYTAVVVDANVYHGSNVIDTDFCLLKSITGGWTWWVASIPSQSAHESRQWTGRVVFDEGEEFAFEVLNGLFDVTCGGYLLSKP